MSKLGRNLKSWGVLALVALIFALQVESWSFLGEWRVRSVESAPTAVSGVLDFSSRSGRVRLKTRCASYEGRYYRGFIGRVSIGGLGPASEVCGEDAALLASLTAATSYGYGLQSMTLSTPGGARLKLFRP